MSSARSFFPLIYVFFTFDFPFSWELNTKDFSQYLNDFGLNYKVQLNLVWEKRIGNIHLGIFIWFSKKGNLSWQFRKIFTSAWRLDAASSQSRFQMLWGSSKSWDLIFKHPVPSLQVWMDIFAVPGQYAQKSWEFHSSFDNY